MRTTLYVLAAIAFGIAAGEYGLRVMFPEPVPAVNDCCAGWTRCPNRAAEKLDGVQVEWYCGPTQKEEVADAGTFRGSMELAPIPTSRHVP